MFYLAADSLCRLKAGGSHSKSKGHSERIKGDPARGYWGHAMAKSVVAHLGYCTMKEAIRRFKVIEFGYLLMFRHFLVNTRHEVRIPERVPSLHTAHN